MGSVAKHFAMLSEGNGSAGQEQARALVRAANRSLFLRISVVVNAVLTLAVVGLVLAVLALQGQRVQFHVAEIGSKGEVVRVTTDAVLSETAAEMHQAWWIEQLLRKVREVYLDESLIQARIAAAAADLAEEPSRVLTRLYLEEDPLGLIRRGERRRVEGMKVQRIAGQDDLFAARWIEVLEDRVGNVQQRTSWDATVKLVAVEDRIPETFTGGNPTGLRVEELVIGASAIVEN